MWVGGVGVGRPGPKVFLTWISPKGEHKTSTRPNDPKGSADIYAYIYIYMYLYAYVYEYIYIYIYVSIDTSLYVYVHGYI